MEKSQNPQTTKNKQTAHWHGPPALFWLSNYVTSHHLAVASKSSLKDQFYSAFYCINLSPIWIAKRVSKILKKMWKIDFKAKINRWAIGNKCLLFKDKIMFKSQ